MKKLISQHQVKTESLTFCSTDGFHYVKKRIISVCLARQVKPSLALVTLEMGYLLDWICAFLALFAMDITCYYYFMHHLL